MSTKMFAHESRRHSLNCRLPSTVRCQPMVVEEIRKQFLPPLALVFHVTRTHLIIRFIYDAETHILIIKMILTKSCKKLCSTFCLCRYIYDFVRKSFQFGLNGSCVGKADWILVLKKRCKYVLRQTDLYSRDVLKTFYSSRTRV